MNGVVTMIGLQSLLHSNYHHFGRGWTTTFSNWLLLKRINIFWRVIFLNSLCTGRSCDALGLFTLGNAEGMLLAWWMEDILF